MVNVGIGVPRVLQAIATTTLESMPPLRYETTGTSARSRFSTDCIITSSKRSTSFGRGLRSSWPRSGKSTVQ